MKERTSLMNMVRGLLLEVGIAIPKGKAALTNQLRVLMDDANSLLSPDMKCVIQHIYQDMKRLDTEIERYQSVLEQLSKEDAYCKRIETLPGVGALTATAIIAKIGNGSDFKNGRELSAYLGLVPKQHSSGEKQVLGRISKHGDRYIRQLLIHGGRSALKAALRKNKATDIFVKQDNHSEWMRKLQERVGMNKASVAIANKNARMILALLKNETVFEAKLAH